jgi:hypothetical protein
MIPSGICIEDRNTTKNLNQDRQWPGRVSDQLPVEYKSKTLLVTSTETVRRPGTTTVTVNSGKVSYCSRILTQKLQIAAV